MKKLVTVLLAVLVLACASAAAEEDIAGGWIYTQSPEMTGDAQAAFDKSLEELAGCTYTPVALIGTQVAAGTNYCILCTVTTVTPEPEVSYALVYVYADLEGSAGILNVTALELGAY